MSSSELIDSKISQIKKYLTILENYQNYDKETISRDVTLTGAVERYLYLIAQATIDLAEMTVSRRNLRKPSTFSETFEILTEAGIIDSDLAEKMIKLAGFRNILAHDYTIIDTDIVYDVLTNRLKDIEQFTAQISRKV